MNSLEQRVKALEARRGLTADGELSPLEADRRGIAAHGEGLAGFYAWLSHHGGRPPGVAFMASGPHTTEGRP